MIITVKPPQLAFDLKVVSPPIYKSLDVTLVRCDASLLRADAFMTLDSDLISNYHAVPEHANDTTVVKHAMSEFATVALSAGNHYHGVYFHSRKRITNGDRLAPYLCGVTTFVDTLKIAMSKGVSSVVVDCEKSFAGAEVVPGRAYSRTLATMIRGVCGYIDHIGWYDIDSRIDSIVLAMNTAAFEAWEQNSERLSSNFLRLLA